MRGGGALLLSALLLHASSPSAAFPSPVALGGGPSTAAQRARLHIGKAGCWPGVALGDAGKRKAISPCRGSQSRASTAMTSAYGGTPGTGTKDIDKLASYLPVRTTLGPVRAEVGPFEESEWERGREIMNQIIFEGLAWPFDKEFDTMDGFRGYFLSHTAFVVRTVEDRDGSDGGVACKKGEIMGIFYVKPNFPGRCSHICNGGFITVDKFRRLGCGRLMAACFLRFAKDLGYKGSYFNLVFANNSPSVRLWDGMGFQRVSVIPQCADLKGVEGLVDAYGYHYDLESLPDDFDPVKAASSKE